MKNNILGIISNWVSKKLDRNKIGSKKQGAIKLTINRVQCLRCKKIIESKSRHDFVMCKCGACFVDGGLDYVRHGFIEKKDILDLCEYEEEV